MIDKIINKDTLMMSLWICFKFTIKLIIASAIIYWIWNNTLVHIFILPNINYADSASMLIFLAICGDILDSNYTHYE